MTIKLLPCPFCGGEADFERIGTHRFSTIISCNNCGCRLENGEEWNHGCGWNTREPMEKKMKGILKVDDEVCVFLGKTSAEVGELTLSQFADLVQSKGGTIHVGEIKDATEEKPAGMSIKMDHGEKAMSISERWMRRWAMRHVSIDYYGDEGRMTDDAAYAFALRAGEDNHIGPYEDARDFINDEWWGHWEAITGKTGERESYFSCSC